MTKRRRLAAAAVLLAHAGCASTSYMPAADGRIARGMDGGKPTLIKDGKSYPANGDGLSQAVAGNLAAEAHARAYNTGMNVAVGEYLGGVGAILGGGILGAQSGEMGMSQSASNGAVAAGVFLVIGGLVLIVVSAFQSTHAQARFQDAINVYNDSVPPRPPPSPVMTPTPPAPLPGVGAPEVTPLPMAPPLPAPAPSESPVP